MTATAVGFDGALADEGPYTMVRKRGTRVANGKTFHVLIYGAYNAFGLIGSECNGIVILNETDHQVVLDEHARANSGYYGPSALQGREWERLMSMPDREFEAFCNHHPRFRRDSL